MDAKLAYDEARIAWETEKDAALRARDEYAKGMITALVAPGDNSLFYKQALGTLDYTGMNGDEYQEAIEDAYSFLLSDSMSQVVKGIQAQIDIFNTEGVTAEGYEMATTLQEAWMEGFMNAGIGWNGHMDSGLEGYIERYQNSMSGYNGGIDTAEVASATEMVEDLTKAIQDLERAKAADKAESQGYNGQMQGLFDIMKGSGTDEEKRGAALAYMNELYAQNSDIVNGMLEQYPALAEIMSALANGDTIDWFGAMNEIMQEMNEQTYLATASDEAMGARLHDLAVEYANAAGGAGDFAKIMEENNDLNEQAVERYSSLGRMFDTVARGG